MRLSARRGAPASFKDAFGNFVTAAFAQAERARNYVLSREQAVFLDRSGAPVYTVRRCDVDEIFFVNPTLAVIDSLGTQLRLVRQSGLLPENPRWPWCIFVNDLRVVSELVVSPSEFVLFLERRLATHDTRFLPHDELDLLCKFFTDGLYAVPEDLKDATQIFLLGFTDMLDRWYIGRAHGAQVEKPGRRLPAQVCALIEAIEATGKPRRTRAATRCNARSYSSACLALRVGRHGWRVARCHEEDELIVKPVQQPNILAHYAPHVCLAGRERGLEVPGTRQVGRCQRAHRRRDRTMGRRSQRHTELRHALAEGRAYAEGSSCHGHSPARMQRSSSSIVMSMKSPLAKSSSACRSSSASVA